MPTENDPYDEASEERLAQESQTRLGITQTQLRAYQDGDAAALDELFARYFPIVRRIAGSRMGRPIDQMADRDDIAQEALMQAFRNIDAFEMRSEGAFRSWLARIVQAKVIDQRRHTHSKKRGSGKIQMLTDAHSQSRGRPEPPGGPTPSQVAQGNELEHSYESALLRLSEFHRELINLRDLCEMTYADIAIELDLNTAATARMATHRARQKLKETLRAMGIAPP